MWFSDLKIVKSIEYKVLVVIDEEVIEYLAHVVIEKIDFLFSCKTIYLAELFYLIP